MISSLGSESTINGAAPQLSYAIPAGHLREPEQIPAYWITALEDISRFLDKTVRKGAVETIGVSAGGREIVAVCYGTPRGANGTTTFSGSVGCNNVPAYFGPNADSKVYMGVGGIHGSEYEGIVGLINLIAVLETGCDLKGRPWPQITTAIHGLDRIVIIPVLNVDGRARIPVRMEIHRGEDESVHSYLTNGAWADGSCIGWPACKQFIPLDHALTQFPGGYPNDAGVNIQHDDFMGNPQPETRALFALTARERPDLMLNLHTGVPPRDYFQRMHRPFMEDALGNAFEELYRRTHTRLMREGLQGTNNPALEATPPPKSCFPCNLDNALNLHCGVMSVLVEAPSHGFSGTNREGIPVLHTPDRLVDTQLICHEEAMRFLRDTGGRAHWVGGKRPLTSSERGIGS